MKETLYNFRECLVLSRVLIGLLVGWAATNLLRVPDHLRYIVLCASALGGACFT